MTTKRMEAVRLKRQMELIVLHMSSLILAAKQGVDSTETDAGCKKLIIDLQRFRQIRQEELV